MNLLPCLRKNDLVARFTAFCVPEITNFTVKRWLARETGHAFTDEQIKWTRKTLDCRPRHGGKRVARGKQGPVVVSDGNRMARSLN